MKHIKLTLTAIAILISISSRAQKRDSTAIVTYIRQYKDIAMDEMKRSGIPASITLAQGIHESSFGTSYLAKNTNNHFGIKCKAEWTGKTFKYTDDAPNECFRVYDKVEDSYKDHSDFLRNRPYYTPLFKLDIYDYKGWAHGLKKAGYATNPKYADILIKTIEDYQLYVFDKGGNPSYLPLVETPAVAATITEVNEDEEYFVTDSMEVAATSIPVAEKKTEPVTVVSVPVQPKPDFTKTVNKKITKINNVNSVKLYKGETLELIGNILRIEKEDLLAYNDITNENQLKDGDVIFLAQKKKSNKEGTYKMKAEDNMWRIAQKKGIRLAALLKMNKLEAGEEPAAKQIIYLKGSAREKPALRAATEIKKDTVKTIVQSVVRANDTIYPAVKEPGKISVDSNTVLSWEKDTKLLEKQEVKVFAKKDTAVVNNNSPAVLKPSDGPTAQIVEQASTPTVYPAMIEYNKLPKSSTGVHTVVKGDTMYNIAKRYTISIAQIMEWNNLSEQTVKLGQVLKIQP